MTGILLCRCWHGTYAYNLLINRSTGIMLFRFVLSGHPHGLMTFHCPSALPTDAKSMTSSPILNARLLHRIAMIGENTDKWLTTFKRRYKYHHDCRRTHATSSLKPGHLVFIDRPRLDSRCYSCSWPTYWVEFKTITAKLGPVPYPFRQSQACFYQQGGYP